MDVQEYWNRLQELRQGIKQAIKLRDIGYNLVSEAHTMEQEFHTRRRNLKTEFFKTVTPEQLTEIEKLVAEDNARNEPPQGVSNVSSGSDW